MAKGSGERREAGVLVAARRRIGMELLRSFHLSPSLSEDTDAPDWVFVVALVKETLEWPSVDRLRRALALAFDDSFERPAVLVTDAMKVVNDVIPRDAPVGERRAAFLAAQTVLRSKAEMPKAKRGQTPDRRARLEAALKEGGWPVPEIADLTDVSPGDREARIRRVEERIRRCRAFPAVLYLHELDLVPRE